MTPRRTSEQPLRTVLRRYRDPLGLLAELECGHTEPCVARPIATALRCRTCLPVRTAPPAEEPTS
jgi:hypothetical protein